MKLLSFNGANGDPVQAPLAMVNGAAEIQNNKLQSIGADPLGPKWIGLMPSKADGFFSDRS